MITGTSIMKCCMGTSLKRQLEILIFVSKCSRWLRQRIQVWWGSLTITMFSSMKLMSKYNCKIPNFCGYYYLFTCRYIAHIENLINRGAPVSGIGIQSHLGPNPVDLAKCEDAMTRIYNRFGLPLWITEFDFKDHEWNDCDQISEDHTQHAIELDNFLRLCLR